MPGWMNAGRSYVPPVGIGVVMRAGAVGEVLPSRHPGFEVGQHVVGMLGVQPDVLSLQPGPGGTCP
jgi:NADPH-dependent curcumin reductase